MSGSIVWLVDDDADLRPAIAQSLTLDGFQVRDFPSGEACRDALDAERPDVVVSDIRMPRMDGTELLAAIQAVEPRLPVILMTGHGDVPLAVRSMRDGAFDFVEKPFDTVRLRDAIERACVRRTSDDVALAPLPLLGPSRIARNLRAAFRALAAGRHGALVVGPPGSGHNRLLVHLLEPFESAVRPVVRVNCGNVTMGTANTEVSDAFSRAKNGAIAFETFSLLPDPIRNEIGRRIAEKDDPIVFLTLTAATRVDGDIAELFASRRIDLPPLSQRREDVASIFFAFSRQAADRFRRPLPPVPAGLDQWLFRQTFEGNVSEVQALAERFVLGTWGFDEGPRDVKLADRVAAHERLLIEAELARNGGRIRPTYEALGLSRKGLYDKMKRLGIAASDV